MADTDLLFKQVPLTQPADLVFGEVETVGDYDVTINATLPALSVSVLVAPVFEVEVAAALPGLTVSVSATYSVDVARPLVSQFGTAWQSGDQAKVGRQDRFQPIAHLQAGKQLRHQAAQQLVSGASSHFGNTDHTRRSGVTARHQDATGVRSSVSTAFADLLRTSRRGLTSAYQNGAKVQTWPIASLWQDMLRDRRPANTSPWQNASASRRSHDARFTSAAALHKGWAGRHQEAMRPPAGISGGPVVPPFDPCYLPDPDLLFVEPFGADSNLVFICERHGGGGDQPTVVVPVRSVYVVINNISLRRVVGNIQLPALSMSLSIDSQSWTWGFSASLPYASRDAIDRGTELEVNINGNLYRVIVERISRDRTFASDRLSISGRGKMALLSDPYSPVLTFANSEERTAQQLMADVLTFNGVPLGWAVDWQLEDWLVPAGAFNVNGTYIDGLNAIAGAAGAYLQPHPTNQQLSVLLRYPVAPWEWNTVTPDFVLPSAVTVQEGIEWTEKPEYNRVYVSGQGQGVLCRVTRAGSAGDLAAPMVVDPLITAATAGRQRGVSILSDTGKQAGVSLRLPVLDETGIIPPGKFVQYVDGAVERLGIVRSTNVTAGNPEAWQTITVETRE